MVVMDHLRMIQVQKCTHDSMCMTTLGVVWSEKMYFWDHNCMFGIMYVCLRSINGIVICNFGQIRTCFGEFRTNLNEFGYAFIIS